MTLLVTGSSGLTITVAMVFLIHFPSFFSFFMNVMLKPSAHFSYHINKKESLLAIKGNSAILSLAKHVLERNEQRISLSILLTSCLGG